MQTHLGAVTNLPALIRATAESWIASGDVGEACDINSGLCADFATAIADSVDDIAIVGIYDLDDLPLCPGELSELFVSFVSSGAIGHTALYYQGNFYDAECPNGCARFEDLPINRRATSVATTPGPH